MTRWLFFYFTSGKNISIRVLTRSWRTADGEWMQNSTCVWTIRELKFWKSQNVQMSSSKATQSGVHKCKKMKCKTRGAYDKELCEKISVSSPLIWCDWDMYATYTEKTSLVSIKRFISVVIVLKRVTHDHKYRMQTCDFQKVQVTYKGNLIISKEALEKDASSSKYPIYVTKFTQRSWNFVSYWWWDVADWDREVNCRGFRIYT